MDAPDASEAPQTGTTIVAVCYAGGVVLGADTRVTTGTYISNRTSDKIAALADNVFLCRSGSAADTQLVSDYVTHFVAQHSMEIGGPPDVLTVAKLAQGLGYNNKGANRGQGLTAAMICAGWDAKKGGQVFSLPIGGTLAPVRWATDGSGSTYIWGFLDAEYREGMSRAQAQAFVKQAICLAMSTDGSSGGCVRLVTVDAAGAERSFHPQTELPVFFNELPVGMRAMHSGGMMV